MDKESEKQMSTINQLVIDCAAKALRINETTNAQIDFEVNGHIHAIECSGWTRGYYAGEKAMIDGIECHERDYFPLKGLPCGWIDLTNANAENNLRNLLDSLNAMEKELLINA